MGKEESIVDDKIVKKNEINSFPPLVSVITVVYNGEEYIEQAIISVVKQSYSNIEYIIIDGASTDNTAAIIEKYKTKITTFISEKDTGIYNAMNKGLALAKGEIVAILNADDYYYSETSIEQVVGHFKATSADVVYGDLIKLRTLNNKDYLKKIEPDLSLIEQTMPIFHPATFIQNKVYNKIGKYNEEYKLSADYDLIYRIYNEGLMFSYLPVSLTVFRIGGATSSSCTSYKEGYQILKSYNSVHQNQMKKLIVKCKRKRIMKAFVFTLIKLFSLESWNEKRIIKKWQ